MLRLRTFGAIDLRNGAGEPADALLSQPKRLAILAILAARPPAEPVRREQLLRLLWPDSRPSAARSALSSSLSRLRGSLGSEHFRGTGSQVIRLAPDCVHSDVGEFEAALRSGDHGRILEAYRGQFLADFYLSGNRSFETWLERRRERYRHQAYQSALRVAKGSQEAGDLAAAADTYRRAFELSPLHEEPARHLIRVLHRLGRDSDAILTYRAYRSRRREELGLPPSPRLETLVEEIRGR